MKAHRDPHGAADTRASIVAAVPRERVNTASSYQQGCERGRAARQRTPRSSHAVCKPAPDRRKSTFLRSLIHMPARGTEVIPVSPL
jgi:hypothetical protein